MKTIKPTSKFYGLFQFIFSYYNKSLFDNKIKDCIIVITRQKKVMGHFSFQKWIDDQKIKVDELAINPSNFTLYPLIEILQTIVHEMAHSYQFHYGKPSRRGYHNKEFAKIMEDIGLMPSHNGRPGGKKVGQNMNDYPIENGNFLKFSKNLLNDDVFSSLYFEVNPMILNQIDDKKPLYEQIKNLTLGENSQNDSKPKNTKIKYSCSCSNVWGKPNLELYCKICKEDFK